MTRLENIGWKIHKLFPDSTGAANAAGAVHAEMDAVVVRLIEPPRRAPATPIEQRLVATLKKAGPVSFAKLVKSVVAALYTEELRKGAAVLDIGLFGDRLFNRDVVRELKAADGILWKINQEQKFI